MSIAEKLITVAENVPKVYHAGQMNVIENAESLKGTANGETIFLDDVSPVEHEMGVRVESKNLITYPYQAISSPNKGMNITVNQDGTIILQNTPIENTFFSITNSLRLSKGSYYFSCVKDITRNIYAYVRNITDDLYYYDYGNGVAFTIDKDVECTISVVVTTKLDLTVPMTIHPQIERGTTASSFRPFVNVNSIKVKRCGKNIVNIPTIDINGGNGTIPCHITKPITISGINDNVVVQKDNGDTANIWRIQVVYADGTTEEMLDSMFSSSKTFNQIAKPSVDIPITAINYRNTYIRSGKYKNIQVELGETATDYEPYICNEYTPTVDGTVNGVTSLYPNTTLMTDTDGVIINCHYYKDINSVFEAGKQSEYDRFWDIYQDYGERRNYTTAFGGNGWSKETFRPKYNIVIDNGYMCFKHHNGGNEPYDMAEHLENLGITLDFQYDSQYAFADANVSRIPPLVFRTIMSWTFARCKAVTIDKISVNANIVYEAAFDQCTNLKNIVIKGVIGQNGFNVSASPLLTHDSLMSIINALKDFREYTTITKTFDTGGLSERIDTLTEGTLVEGQEYTWSFYCTEYPGWLVNDINTPPTDIQTTITSIAEQITVDGNTYTGFKAETTLWSDWESTYAVYVYQDGAEIKVYRSHAITGDIINLSIDKPTETRTITLGETNLNKLTDSQKAMATEKGWSLV